MTLKELYKKAVSTGVENDPRGKDAVLKELDARKKDFEKLKEDEKEFFDSETLENPYSDSRILNGTGEEKIKSALVGIDIEVGELLLAENLKAKGKSVDLLISHHPEGGAYANLYSVMQMQSDILHRFGVPINVAEDLMDGRIKEVERKLMPVNHTRAVDAAKLLGIPFVCLHTPADNMVATYLQRLFDEKKPYRISDVMEALKGIPEYRTASFNGAGPKILIGSKNRRAGKIFVDMTGGTEGSKEIFESLTAGGVNTIVAMHLGEEHRKEAEKNHLNVVIAGHIASDNVGINLLLDELSRSSLLEILECSGFKRVSRN
ncbi:MAG: NGG1p interacting factor NIF3 [Nitrospirae bacterium GWF2_44_13]|nr:MAG: NGG1p interacting factor NIF3 [Nitrospirae bacterium GWF2_44_13]OGW33377.1 MAG: NGG1p interacting factor NIF3 [Nitrospirae bacterium GWD2_44_7]OGW65282.1 MAG: NGG1p interacting factor NIF3 [Nitrospirae bacterium RIFOXYA2_FULL_44_9]HBG93413.1 NGG1p interacting factor NIF3 [Nitrospiraceae bacterium]